MVMRDWLLGCGVTIEALELTSTYWKGCFYCLEDHMGMWLLNAAHMHPVPGRKSDVEDFGVDRSVARARAVESVVRTAAGDPPAADADPAPDPVDGRPYPGHDPVGADVGGRRSSCPAWRRA